jgi:GT2 family glycosyltransferase
MIAVIPTRYRPPELAELLSVLKGDGIEAIVLDSADFDHRIYAGWNRGVDMARAACAETVVILNDDVTLLPGSLSMMEQALWLDPIPAGWIAPEWPTLAVVYPDVNAPWHLPMEPVVQRTTGTWGVGGMTGFCFIFRTDLLLPRFDESYHWWYGDDAFEQGVRDAGYGIGRVVGVPIRHIPDGSASKRWDELQPLIEEDRARWDAAWQARASAYYAGQRERPE